MKKLIFIGLLILLFACRKDFIVEDIKDKTLTVNAPADNTTTSNNSVTFWWELLDGAEKYNIQIVKPNFASVQQLVTDTNVTGNKLTLSLTPGIYQWRIKGVNNGGSTAYQTYNLKIDTTNNLALQTVISISPSSGIVTANKTFTFSWNSLAAADKYEIQILNGASVLIDTITSNTTYIRTIPTTTTGNFSWKVKAINNTSISQYNAARTFKIDLTSPGVPYSLFPINGTTTAKLTDTLKWTRSPSSADISYDSLYVYSDIGLAAIYATASVPNKKIKIGDIVPVLTNAPYWWRVRSKDSVGNSSVFSATTSFTLIP